jgi:ribosomal protein S18 acetylase RimI-like enzyme
VPAIIQLQSISLPHFPLADPGPAFLRGFYSFLLCDPQGLLFAAEHDHKLAGFVAGLVEPGRLYRRIASERLHVFVAATACLARHPIQLPRLFRDFHKARRLKYELSCCDKTACELVTIAIQPRLRRQGYGRALILALVEAARFNKMTQLCVHVGSDNERMASFYRRLGFKPLCTMVGVSDARWVDEYVLAIRGNRKTH